jgi:hypothetical protein
MHSSERCITASIGGISTGIYVIIAMHWVKPRI